jgi:hypothetical protein
VQLANRDVKSPGVSSQLPQAIQTQTDTLADADTCGAHEQQGVGIQVVGATELLLQEPIVLRRKRAGQISRRRREVLRADKVWRNGVAVGSQIVEHPAKTEQIAAAGLVGQRRLMVAEMAEPGEQMRIASELGESAYPGEILRLTNHRLCKRLGKASPERKQDRKPSACRPCVARSP